MIDEIDITREKLMRHYLSGAEEKEEEGQIRECIFNYSDIERVLALRISFKVSDAFIPVTFICNTMAPGSLYLTRDIMRKIRSRVKTSELDNLYVECMGYVDEEPQLYNITEFDVNMIGLKLLTKWGLTLSEEGGFNFKYLPEFI